MLRAKFRSLAAAAATAAALAVSPASQAAFTYTAAAVPFSFTDISGTGTVVAGLTNQDDTAVSVGIGFTFGFYASTSSSVFVSSNGLLTFGSGNTTFTNADLTTSPVQAAIAAFWDDLHAGGGAASSNVFTQTSGAAGSRQFIVQWNDVRFFSGGTPGDTLTLQAILFEATGDILFNYLDLVSGTAGGNNGASATVGVKNVGAQGSDRLLLAFNNGPNAFVGTGQSTLISAHLVQVPEPASLALIGIALAGLALSRRRAR